MTDNHDPPKRFLEPHELSVDQHVARLQALKRGEAEPKFESAEYLAAKRQALLDRGLEPDDEPTVDWSTASVDEHLKQIRANR